MLCVVLAKKLWQRIPHETLQIVHSELPALNRVVARPYVQNRLAALREGDAEEPGGLRLGFHAASIVGKTGSPSPAHFIIVP